MVGTVVAVATGIGSAAFADGVRVSPGAARPGQRVHLSVPDCAVGPTRHTAASAAFAGRATLHGKADTGEADATVRPGLAPGTYPITASCGRHTAAGRIVVTGSTPTPAPGTSVSRGRHGPYWALAAGLALLVAGGGALLAARRRRG